MPTNFLIKKAGFIDGFVYEDKNFRPSWEPRGDYRLTAEHRRQLCVHLAAHAVVGSMGGADICMLGVVPAGERVWASGKRKRRWLGKTGSDCNNFDLFCDYLSWDDEHQIFIADRDGWESRNSVPDVPDEQLDPGLRLVDHFASQRQALRSQACGYLAGHVADSIAAGMQVTDALRLYDRRNTQYVGASDIAIAQGITDLLPPGEYEHVVHLTEAALRRPEVWAVVQRLASELEQFGYLEYDHSADNALAHLDNVVAHLENKLVHPPSGDRFVSSVEAAGFIGRAEVQVRFLGRKRLRLKHVLGLGVDCKSHDGALQFVGTSHIYPDAAAELARYPGAIIGFPDLQTITPEAARAIAEFSGVLDLSGLTAVPPEAAVAIANGRAEVFLRELGRESNDGSLIVRLSDEGVFNFGDIRHLTPEVAATLSAAQILEFRNLKKLTPAAAHVLTEKHKGSLLLDGLKSLPYTVAAALSGHDGSLSLRGLTHISLAAAKSLTSLRGSLSLSGLTKLRPRLAAVLAEFPGSLMLDGLTELTPAAARKLQKHTGMLSMNGLTEISLETAKILAKKPNQKRMARCSSSVAAVQYLLENDGNRVTMMFQLNSDRAFE